MAVPTRCLEDNPSHRSILLGETAVSIIKVSHATGINHGYLSRIFTGEREPSLYHIRSIAKALGVGVEDLLTMIQERKDGIMAECRRRIEDSAENPA